jgi:hypothetical protein
MQWPKELLAAVDRGLMVEAERGRSKADVIQAILDETARRAVWRAEGKPERLGDCLRAPYTPLGSVFPDYHVHFALRLGLERGHWSKAVDAINDHMEANAAAICAAFRDEQEPYDDLSGQWTE